MIIQFALKKLKFLILKVGKKQPNLLEKQQKNLILQKRIWIGLFRNLNLISMKVVLDTNIWLSAIFWKGEAYKLINFILNKKIEIIITNNILSEIIEVLNKEVKFQKFIEDRKQRIEDLIRTVLSFSTLIETKSKFDLIKEHSKDNIILEAAFDSNAASKIILSFECSFIKSNLLLVSIKVENDKTVLIKSSILCFLSSINF